MQGILYDATKIKVCQGMYAICEYAQLDKEWADELWKDIVTCKEIYDEFVYYVEHHTFKDQVKVEGYSLSDLYVWQMDKYNLVSEIGKNPGICNKERMVMKAFRTMIDMMRNPAEFVKRLESGRGEDRL